MIIQTYRRSICLFYLDSTQDDFNIFMAQLHLFARLCKVKKRNKRRYCHGHDLLQGNNKVSIELLTYPMNKEGFISFEEAILCARNTSLTPTLRSRYVELLLVMFVDVGENIPFLDSLNYSFVRPFIHACNTNN